MISRWVNRNTDLFVFDLGSGYECISLHFKVEVVTDEFGFDNHLGIQVLN